VGCQLKATEAAQSVDLRKENGTVEWHRTLYTPAKLEREGFQVIGKPTISCIYHPPEDDVTDAWYELTHVYVPLEARTARDALLAAADGRFEADLGGRAIDKLSQPPLPTPPPPLKRKKGSAPPPKIPFVTMEAQLGDVGFTRSEAKGDGDCYPLSVMAGFEITAEEACQPTADTTTMVRRAREGSVGLLAGDDPLDGIEAVVFRTGERLPRDATEASGVMEEWREPGCWDNGNGNNSASFMLGIALHLKRSGLGLWLGLGLRLWPQP